MSQSKNRHCYIRFLELCQNTELSSGALSTDLTAIKLLEVIALAESTNNPIQVTHLMNCQHIASPATIHRKMTQLLDANLIEQKFVGKNRRTKYLIVTDLANQYFEKRGALLKLINSQQ